MVYKAFYGALQGTNLLRKLTARCKHLRKQSEIDIYLGKLKNPPEKFEDAYDEFKELYYAYSDYVDFVILCKGSYNTYTEDLSKKSSALMESYREIKVELLGK